MKVWGRIKDFYERYYPLINVISINAGSYLTLRTVLNHFGHSELTSNPNPVTSLIGVGTYLTATTVDHIITRKMFNVNKRIEKKFGKPYVIEGNPLSYGLTRYRDILIRYIPILAVLSYFAYDTPIFGISFSIGELYASRHNTKMIKNMEELLKE